MSGLRVPGRHTSKCRTYLSGNPTGPDDKDGGSPVLRPHLVNRDRGSTEVAHFSVSSSRDPLTLGPDSVNLNLRTFRPVIRPRLFYSSFTGAQNDPGLHLPLTHPVYPDGYEGLGLGPYEHVLTPVKNVWSRRLLLNYFPVNYFHPRLTSLGTPSVLMGFYHRLGTGRIFSHPYQGPWVFLITSVLVELSPSPEVPSFSVGVTGMSDRPLPSFRVGTEEKEGKSGTTTGVSTGSPHVSSRFFSPHSSSICRRTGASVRQTLRT